MKSTVRLLLVCFLMLALPFQAFASASMRPPVAHAPAHVAASAEQAPVAPVAQLPPCHQQMKMAAATVKSDDDGHAGRHAKGKCGTCAACNVGAAMAPSLPAALAPAPPCTASIPFRAGHLPSVDPVLPERPPSTLPA